MVLLGGLLLRKPVLELLFRSGVHADRGGLAQAHPALGACFFVAMAIVNEVVWRNFSTDTWVSFKAFGFLPLTLLFALAQMPLIQRHGEPPADDSEAEKRT